MAQLHEAVEIISELYCGIHNAVMIHCVAVMIRLLYYQDANSAKKINRAAMHMRYIAAMRLDHEWQRQFPIRARLTNPKA